MSSSSEFQLWRTQLCRHGSGHSRYECRFAHSLAQLRPPDESAHSYSGQWRECNFDRFYGQRVSQEQITRIEKYYNEVPLCDIPLWAHGLYLLHRGLEDRMGLGLPWDFGLCVDHDDLLDRRLPIAGRRLAPFAYYPHIWERLTRRRQCILSYAYPCHALGMRWPSPPPVAIDPPAAAVSGSIANTTADAAAGQHLGGPSIASAALAGPRPEAVSIAEDAGLAGSVVSSAEEPIAGSDSRSLETSMNVAAEQVVTPMAGDSNLGRSAAGLESFVEDLVVDVDSLSSAPMDHQVPLPCFGSTTIAAPSALSSPRHSESGLPSGFDALLAEWVLGGAFDVSHPFGAVRPSTAFHFGGLQAESLLPPAAAASLPPSASADVPDGA